MRKSFIYLLSFLEGAAVMACELIGARMLAPNFGASLHVWAAALGLTLGGLMTGYFTGGLLSRRFPDQPALLYWLLVLAGWMLALMPFTSGWIMERTLSLPLHWGAILSLLVFMFPPLVLMGMVSPVIINLLNTRVKDAGNHAGNIYAISTLGGIGATFAMGFYIIPSFGIDYPAWWSGLILSLFPLIALFRIRRVPALLALLPFALLALSMTAGPQQNQAPEEEALYHSEGILGQVRVVDREFQRDSLRFRGRGLVVNNTLQTVMRLDDPDFDFWPYTEVIPRMAAQAGGGRALLLGMGGGTLLHRLEDLGFEVDVVEIDGRIRLVAEQFFHLPPGRPVIIDDARHYLKTCAAPYRLIVYDTFISEGAPEHVLTAEGLEEARCRLEPDGLLLINFYGYTSGPLGEITRSVYKTLQVAGFSVSAYALPGSERERNVVFFCSPGAHPPFTDNILQPIQLDTAQAAVLTDRMPRIDLYARASEDWRRFHNLQKSQNKRH